MIGFQSLTNAHFPLLLRWLEEPHVKVWWDHNIQWNMQKIEAKYGEYVDGFKTINLMGESVKKAIHAHIIEYDDQSIGYIQYYDHHDFLPEPAYMAEELPKSLARIDWYIGERNFTGRGIGSQALRVFLELYVFEHFEAVLVEVDKTNQAAIRAYEKAGFEIICEKTKLFMKKRK